MNITFHGHAAVHIETNGKNIWIDPFINGNSQCTIKVEDVKADAILLTHGHNDHVGDTVEIAKNNDSLVISSAEIATYLGWQGVNTHGMNIGGAYSFDFGRVKFTQAFHSSSFTEDENKQLVYLGMPMGILLEAEGKTIYHMGDTALFSDMKLIGERHKIDVLFVPIGDNFTMGPEDAKQAVEWLQPEFVIPIHYNTFPVIEQDGEAFIESIAPTKGKALKPGETMTI